MEHQTPSGFPGNFRKLKVLGTLWFPSGLPETLVKVLIAKNLNKKSLSLVKANSGPPPTHTRARGRDSAPSAHGSLSSPCSFASLCRSDFREEKWFFCVYEEVGGWCPAARPVPSWELAFGAPFAVVRRAVSSCSLRW